MIFFTFWFNAYFVVTLFSFSFAFVERILGLAGDFVLIDFPNSCRASGSHMILKPASPQLLPAAARSSPLGG